MSRGKLVEDLDRAYGEFLGELDSVDEREFEKIWLDARWRVREIAAHCTGWLGQFAAGMERMARGERPNPHETAWTDVERWNETFASHARGKRKPEVLHELDRALHSFKNAASKLPEERFGEGKTASQFFDLGGISHFREHAEAIRQWRAGEWQE